MENTVKQKIKQTFQRHPFVAHLKTKKDEEMFLRFLDSLGFRCINGQPCMALRPSDYYGAYFVYVRGAVTWCGSYVCRDEYPTLIIGAKRSIRFIKDTVSKIVLN